MPRRSVYIPATEDTQIAELARDEGIPFHVMLQWILKLGLVERLKKSAPETAAA